MLTVVFRRLSRSSGANSPPWIRFSLVHIRDERLRSSCKTMHSATTTPPRAIQTPTLTRRHKNVRSDGLSKPGKRLLIKPFQIIGPPPRSLIKREGKYIGRTPSLTPARAVKLRWARTKRSEQRKGKQGTHTTFRNEVRNIYLEQIGGFREQHTLQHGLDQLSCAWSHSRRNGFDPESERPSCQYLRRPHSFVRKDLLDVAICRPDRHP